MPFNSPSVLELLTTRATCKAATFPDRLVYGWPLAPVSDDAAPMLIVVWFETGEMTIRLVGLEP
jgi:hypothetical protein